VSTLDPIRLDEFPLAPQFLSHLTLYLNHFVLSFYAEWLVALQFHFSLSFLSMIASV
jgi:hypothetical protein